MCVEESNAIKDVLSRRKMEERIQILDHSSESQEITMLNVVLTMKCDGRCLYCYAADNIADNMPEITIGSIQEQLANLRTRGYILNVSNVRFYGGEPFKSSHIGEIVSFLHQEFPNCLFYISTGLLLNEEDFQQAFQTCKTWIEQQINFYLGVTVDFGVEDKNFTRRNIYHYNRETLLERTSKLEQIGCSVRYVSILNKYTDADLLFKHLIQHFASKPNLASSMSTTGEKKLTYRICCADHPTLYPTTELLTDVAHRMLNSYDLPITSNLFPYTDVVFNARVVCLEEDVFTLVYPNMYCKIFNGLITLTPFGFTDCHMTPYKNQLEPSSQEEKLLLSEECRNCSFFLMCRGGCIKRRVFLINSPEAQQAHCIWTKYSYILGVWRLWKMYPSKQQFKDMLCSHVDRKQIIM